MKNKKAQSLGGLYSGILVIASIGIMLALVLYILSSMGTSFLAANTPGTVVNESGAKATNAGITLAIASAGLTDVSCGAITAIYNVTGSAVLVPLGNITQVGCLVKNKTTTEIFSATWLYNYPYTYSANTNSSIATQTVTAQFVAFLPWMGIILLVLAAGVVLFFVIRSFAGGSKGV